MRQLKITKSITNRESASLDKYLQEIGREELITIEEEVDLAQRIRKGDKVALEKLTRANLRFVVSVANSIRIKVSVCPTLSMKVTWALSRQPKNSMKPVALNLSPMQYGG
jgi:hypothetical protein